MTFDLLHRISQWHCAFLEKSSVGFYYDEKSFSTKFKSYNLDCKHFDGAFKLILGVNITAVPRKFGFHRKYTNCDQYKRNCTCIVFQIPMKKYEELFKFPSTKM